MNKKDMNNKVNTKNKKYKKYNVAKTNKDKELDFLLKYGLNSSSDLIISILKNGISDIIFQQHLNDFHTLNVCIISIQLLVVFIDVILRSIFEINTMFYCAIINILLCFLVVINTIIHTYMWNKSTKRLNELSIGFDILKVRCKSEVCKDLEFKLNLDIDSMLKELDDNERK